MSNEEGASLVEYALLVALIAVVAIVAITVVGEQVSDNFSSNAAYFSAVSAQRNDAARRRALAESRSRSA